MRLNYYYNFKNTIRFFINIDDMDFSSIDVNKRTWSKPFKFRIRKDENSFRTLQIPNIYNFKVAYDYYNSKLLEMGLDLENINNLDIHKRMQISYDLGEFKENSYNKWQLLDYKKLTEYDLLIRCDIKSFYDNIYTHYIFNDKTDELEIDKPLTHMYNGRTAGIIMGNYLSLYVAEVLSSKVSKRFREKIIENKIDCNYSYFSDDFYIYVNKEDKNNVLKLFDETLEEFDLERNEDKLKIYDYLKYTKEDVIEKYWKIITRECKEQQYQQNIEIREGKREFNNNLIFTNKLIYRLNKIEEYKNKRVFIVNFFKSNFFRKIEYSKTFFDEYNYHQLLYLIKEFPEIVLYIDSILSSFEKFKSKEFKDMIILYYKKSLYSNYHDEQLYYYYLLNKLKVKDEIKELNEDVLKTNNYVLISYYINNKMFNDSQLDVLKNIENEEYWLIYYYLILNDDILYSNLDDSIEKYLIPKSTNKEVIKEAYQNFYKSNLTQKKEIIVDLSEVDYEIYSYFKEKYEKEEEDLPF